MNISKLKISTDQINRLVDYLIENLSFEFESHSSDMTILATEDYYFRNGSTQLNMIILKRVDDWIEIEILGTAGGSGLLNISWGSEKEYPRRVRKILQTFIDAFNLDIQEL